METRLFVNGLYRNFKPTDFLRQSRQITSFAYYNGFRDCLVRVQKGWYKLELNGTMTFQTRALYLITFEDLFRILTD